MKVLITCEYSGTVRDAFASQGHNSQSCDFEPSEKPGYHYQGDAFDIIDKGFDFIGCHYTCTFMANSGVRWLWNKDGSKNTERWIELEKSVNTFNRFKQYIKRGYIENPIPHKYARDGFYSVTSGLWVNGIGKYNQTIQPYEFGHTTSKRTCLWLIDLPNLKPTLITPKEQRTYEIHLAPPGPNRWKERSRTFSGIAGAMVDQWGSLPFNI